MLKILLLLFCFNVHGAPLVSRMSEFWRSTQVYPQYQKSLYQERYLKWHREINPFIPQPYVSLWDTAKDYNDNVIYDVFYNTGELGLRITPEVKKGLDRHLIVAGDSNTFGVGCSDTQTLPYYLSKKLPEYNVVNFGLGGTGINSILRFMEIFSVKEMVPENYKKGIFVLDFHAFTIDRVVGTKSFLNWGHWAPRYVLEDNVPVYKGPFSKSWQAFFYKMLDKLPYGKKLFPDLPQIEDRHIELTAQMIIAIKNKYLEQTSMDNKFVVFLNPEYKEYRPLEYRDDSRYLNRRAVLKKLQEYKIDVVEFEDREVLELKHINIEGHYAPEGHQAFAEMVYKKLKERI